MSFPFYKKYLSWKEYRDKAFAWKVRWRIQHDRNPLLVTVQDKLSARSYASVRGVASPRLLHVTQSPETIPYDEFHGMYFIKAAHGCGWNIVCINNELYLYGDGRDFFGSDGSPVSPDAISKHRITRQECAFICGRWLELKYSGKEWAYQKIEPYVLVEEAVCQNNYLSPLIYRFFTMGGSVQAVSVGGPIFARPDTDNIFFYPDWKRINMTRETIKVDADFIWHRPNNLKQMIAASEALGENMDFVRVDLFNTPGGPLLSELTVYPHGGSVGTPSSCRRFNRWLGERWQLPADPIT